MELSKAKVRCNSADNLRKVLKMTHEEFAKLLGISPSLSKAWALGDRYPRGAAWRLINVVWENDKVFRHARRHGAVTSTLIYDTK